MLEDEEGENSPGSDEGWIILFCVFLTREKNALVRNGAQHEYERFPAVVVFLGFSVGREQCLNYLNFSQRYNRNTDNTELINIW